MNFPFQWAEVGLHRHWTPMRRFHLCGGVHGGPARRLRYHWRV